MTKNRNIIVTGGAGFIGSHTVVSLIKDGYTPIIIDDFRNSERFIIDRIELITGSKVTVFSFDCANLERIREVFERFHPVGVIHFAADKAVGESMENPLKYYQNNLQATVSMLTVCDEYNVENFVFSSSCTVYGDPDVIPVTEKAEFKLATSPYGFTKQVCERICVDTAKSSKNLKITLLRYFNPIGAHPSGLIGELPLGVPNNLVPYITQTAAGIREQLLVHGDDYPTTDGTCIRDYIHVCDLANAHVLAINNSLETTNTITIYNVGTGDGSSVLDVVRAFEKVTGQKLNYKIGPRRSGDVVAVYADNSKLVAETGWKPEFSLEDAMSHAWNWQLKLGKQ